MIASVIIASYQRAAYLQMCLESVLKQQTYDGLDYEVIIVIRQGDQESECIAKKFINKRLTVIYVEIPGVIFALKAGVFASKVDIVLFIDDDAEAPVNWISSHCRYYMNDFDSSVSCVAGRDILDIDFPKQKFSFGKVGRVTLYGRLIGDHCQAGKLKQEIDVPKGVNMSIRRNVLQLPNHLLGDGAQVHWEVFLGLAVKHLGQKLIYDPDIIVYHHVAPRPKGDSRMEFSRKSVYAASYNFSYSFAKFRSKKECIVALLYWSLIGDGVSPGLLRCLVGYKNSDLLHWYMGMKGHLSGVRRGWNDDSYE